MQEVKTITQIPFLPIQFFKSHKIVASNSPVQEIFTSSGTTSTGNSNHYVTDVSLYEQSYQLAFSQFYGNSNDYAILALLPNYLDRKGSSLIYLVNDLIQQSKNPHSGFYLNNYKELLAKLIQLKKEGQNILLIGVTYALLDLAELIQSSELFFNETLNGLIIMETGGMKGRRKEMIRAEVHDLLKKGFGISAVHSEYGMTELLSQAYSKGEGLFSAPPWMKVLVRDEEDPLAVKETGAGVINIIDLANIDSCCFIATDDAGKVHRDGRFEVLGRMDGSDLRGCSLMVL